MKTNTVALIMLIAGVAGIEISGFWMLYQNRRNSPSIYGIIGKALCWGGLLILGLGMIGLSLAVGQ